MAHEDNRKNLGLSRPSKKISRKAIMPPSGELDEEAEDVSAMEVVHQTSDSPPFQIWTPPPLEMEALSFFFNNIVRFSETSEDSASGWLSELRGVHNQSKVDSHLDKATTALSWVNLGTATDRPKAIENAREAYCHALSKTREALNDPSQRRTDETLVAVLVLGYFEV